MKKKVTIPSDFETELDFLADIKKKLTFAVSRETENRREMKEDLDMTAGIQWKKSVKDSYDKKNLPVVTQNILLSFVNQVANKRLANETRIKIKPVDGVGAKDEENKKIADLRQGLIKNIERNSNASEIYTNTHFKQIICGASYFYLDQQFVKEKLTSATEYGENMFDQELVIKEVGNPLSVLMDPNSISITGKDAEYCFIMDVVPRSDFGVEEDTKNLTGFSALSSLDSESIKVPDDHIRVVDFYRMVEKTRTIALLRRPRPAREREDVSMSPAPMDAPMAMPVEEPAPTGYTLKAVDVTDLSPSEWKKDLVLNSEGSGYIRKVPKVMCEMYTVGDDAILAGAILYNCSRLPVFSALGTVINTSLGKSTFGLVRHNKDTQVMHNTVQSALAASVRNPKRPYWLTSDGAIRGRETVFADSIVQQDEVVVYNEQAAAAPQYQQPSTIDPLLMQLSNSQYVAAKENTGVHASINGDPRSNLMLAENVSAAQDSNSHFQRNLNSAIEALGRTMNELIPSLYDNEREITIIDDNDEEKSVQINLEDENQIKGGRFSVSAAAEPTFKTKKRETNADMLQMLAMTAEQDKTKFMDVVAKNLDFAGSDVIAMRFKRALSTQLLSPQEREQLGYPPLEEEQAFKDKIAAQLKEEMQVEMQENEQRQMIAAKIDKEKAQTQEIMAKTQTNAQAAEVGLQKTLAETDEIAQKADKLEVETALIELENPQL